MAYLLRYNGTGGVTAPTLGNLLTPSKVKFVISPFRLTAGANAIAFWQGGATASLRELVFRRNGTNWEIYVGNASTIIGTTAAVTAAFGNAELACDEFAFELEGTTCRLYKDGAVVFTKTSISRSTGRLNNALLYIGCAPANDTVGNTALNAPAPNGSEYGDISVFIDDALVRDYVMPGTGSTIPDSVGGLTATQNGTWPADNSEWVFYDAGGAITASAAFNMPQMSIAAASTVTAPVYSGAISVTMPQMQVSVSGNVLSPGVGASVNFVMPQMMAEIDAATTAPTYTADVNVTMPQMSVSAAANVIVSGVSGSVAVSMPQFTVLASGSITSPVIAASISLTMPQMVVHVSTFEADYFAVENIDIPSASTSIELIAASRHLEYTNQSSHLEWRA